MTEYFYDTCAIIDFLKGDPRLRPYFLERRGATAFYNILEVFYILLRDEGEEKARNVLNHLTPLRVEPSVEDIEPAMRMRLEYKGRRKLPYTDCLGYAIAKRKGLRFLTSDPDFTGMQNAELIRKE